MKNWLEYNKVKQIIKGKFTCRREFNLWKKNHHEIPSEEHFKFTGEWISWGDFLGTGYVSTTMRNKGYYWSFKQARVWIRKLKFQSQRQWEIWNRTYKRPEGMPMACSKVYQKQWKGWADFLDYKPRKRFCKDKWNYEQASTWVQKQKLKTKLEFSKKKKRKNWLPMQIGLDPESYFRAKEVWKGWNHFLGTPESLKKSRDFRSFRRTKNWVKKNKIKHYDQYKQTKKPIDIPQNPDKIYKDKGWKNWASFLETEYATFFKAKNYLRSLRLTSYRHYVKLYDQGKITINLPKNLWTHYKRDKHFKSMADMIGTKSKCYNFWEFEKARDYIRKLKLQNQTEYFEARRQGKVPKEIPCKPEHIYKRVILVQDRNLYKIQ